MNINTKKYLENYIKIIDKKGKLVDFKLNTSQQKLYDVIKKLKKEGKPVRIIILKPRQLGFSTFTEALLLKNTITHFNKKTGIITHLDTATTNLFNMSKLMYENLPDYLKPSIKNSNAKELIFNNDDGTGLNSRIKCMTAGTSGVGRSDTYHNLHLSEVAFWSGDVKATLTGLLQSVPNEKDTMIIVETTANGFNYFKTMWDSAVKGENDFYPFFVAWYEHDEYQMKYDGFDLTTEEKELKELYKLSNEQLAWRRWCIRNNCQNDEDMFKQEYPANPEEAFLSTGNCIFDKDKIIKRMQEISKPLRVGYFTYNIEKAQHNIITDIKWVEDKKNGYIKIYKAPNGNKYTIGGDTAGDTVGDEFSADVIDAQTLEQVASMEMQTDEDLFAKQIYCLGKYYSNALISIETNFSTYPQKKLEEFNYPNFYIRETTDRYDKSLTKQFGFNTNRKTKPIILGNLVQLVRDFPNIINDYKTLDEMLTMVRKENGSQEAQDGYHDDKVMSIAIAYNAISQIHFDKEPIIVPPQFSFNIEKQQQPQIDYGEQIQVI